MRTRTLFLVGLAAALVLGCTDRVSSPPTEDVGSPSLMAVDVQEYSFPYELDPDPPYDECATGESMQNHGTVMVHVRETITPSGHLITSGWVDYGAFGEVTLEGLDSGDMWTLHTGHNPFNEVVKENGFYVLAYQWSELYFAEDGRTLHVHLKGHFKIETDGTVRIARESYTCR